MYSDGGPDHRVTYRSVKLALISLFVYLDLDYICAARTAPYHSFRNPAERVMSILNLGLQSVGLARTEMDEVTEAAVHNFNSVAEIRRVTAEKDDVRIALLDSVAPVKALLSRITQRLQLKENKFAVGNAAAPTSLSNLWDSLVLLDSEFSLNHTDKVSAKVLTQGLKTFMSHCCRERHYFFEIKKCGEENFQICHPVRSSPEEFAKFKPFPDPVCKVMNLEP